MSNLLASMGYPPIDTNTSSTFSPTVRCLLVSCMCALLAIYTDPPGIPISQSSPRGIGHVPSVVVYGRDLLALPGVLTPSFLDGGRGGLRHAHDSSAGPPYSAGRQVAPTTRTQSQHGPCLSFSYALLRRAPLPARFLVPVTTHTTTTPAGAFPTRFYDAHHRRPQCH